MIVGSAIVTILTVMAVTAIGTALTAKSTTNITKQFTSDSTKINAYVIELDSDGNPTSNVIEYAEDKTEVSVTIVGSERAFEDVYSFNNDNTKYEFTINGVTAESSKVEFVMDSETSGEAGLVFYVDSDAYKTISASDSIKANLSMNSTLEVERVGFKYFSLIVGILNTSFLVKRCFQKKGGRLVFHFVQAPTVRLDHSHASMTAILAFFSCPPDCSPVSACSARSHGRSGMFARRLIFLRPALSQTPPCHTRVGVDLHFYSSKLNCYHVSMVMTSAF